MLVTTAFLLKQNVVGNDIPELAYYMHLSIARKHCDLG